MALEKRMALEKCPFCDKVDFKGPGPRNIHVLHCELKYHREKEEGAKGGKGKGKEKCKHEWRALVGNNYQEAQALKAGFVKVCTKKECEELA